MASRSPFKKTGFVYNDQCVLQTHIKVKYNEV